MSKRTKMASQYKIGVEIMLSTPIIVWSTEEDSLKEVREKKNARKCVVDEDGDEKNKEYAQRVNYVAFEMEYRPHRFQPFRTKTFKI